MRYLLLFLILGLVLISACNRNGVSGGRGTTIEFLKNQPPSTIYEDQTFQVGIQITNSADYDINGLLCVFDTPSDSFGGIPERPCEPIIVDKGEQEKNKIIPSTLITYLPSKGGVSYTNLVGSRINSNIVASLEYSNEDTIRIETCLKRDPSIETKDVKCNSDTTITKIPTKGPVTITKIEQSVVPEAGNQRVILDISLSNTVAGQVINSENVGNEIEQEENLLDINIGFLGTTSSFTCRPVKDGRIEFNRNERVINCNSIISMNQDYYTDTLVIKLGYGYRITKTVSANLIPKNEEI